MDRTSRSLCTQVKTVTTQLATGGITFYQEDTNELLREIDGLLRMLAIRSRQSYEYHSAKIAYEQAMKAVSQGPDKKWTDVV